MGKVVRRDNKFEKWMQMKWFNQSMGPLMRAAKRHSGSKGVLKFKTLRHTKMQCKAYEAHSRSLRVR